MKCPTCSTELPENANYCPGCGRLVRQVSRPQEAGTTLEQPAAGSTKIPGWVIVLIVVGVLAVFGLPFLAIVAAIAIPNFIHARDVSQMAANQANLRQIATALEEYAVDHHGQYPDRLAQLQPAYLKSLPEIPGETSGGTYTYHRPAVSPVAAAYDVWDDGTMDSATFGRIARAGGGTCTDSPMRIPTACKYVVYVAGSGIVGVPGSVPRNKARSRAQ